MIARRQRFFEPVRWQVELARAISSPAELLEILNLSGTSLALQVLPRSSFRLRVPHGFVARMRKGDPYDPLLRQVLPVAHENNVVPGYVTDPVGDLESETVPGVLHKYQRRALLVTTGACPIHCRYCFRRHFPYAESNPAANRWQAALDYIRSDTSITEVLLSGGDPLSLTDRRLAELAHAIARIQHVQRLRVHTRMPIVLPERVEDDMLDWLCGTRLHPVMVVHANHANEIDQTVKGALERLAKAGVTLLNQAVLLSSVNDTVDALAELSETLFRARVLPYYLHLLDPVRGAAHFAVHRETAFALMHGLRARLPGYLVPRFVQEKSGAPYKLPLELARA